jgi:hypothetical protein
MKTSIRRTFLLILALLFATALHAQTYSYTVSTDFPGGEADVANLILEIGNSAIVTALDDIQLSGDSMDIIFKAALSAGDKTILDGDTTGPAGGLIAAHDSVAKDDPLVMAPVFAIDAHRAQLDGHSLSCEADDWCVTDMSLPRDLHLQEAFAVWEGAKIGDYILVTVLHPLGDSTVAATASASTTEVTVGAGEASYYNPAVGAEVIEFWNGGDLQEAREIDHVDGSVVHVKSGFSQEITSGWSTKSRFAAFNPLRGTDGTEGGFQILGSHSFQMNNPHSLTAVMPTGMVFSTRLHTSVTVGTRNLSCNFIFRIPVE